MKKKSFLFASVLFLIFILSTFIADSATVFLLPKIGHFGRENCLTLRLCVDFETACFFPPDRVRSKCNNSDTPCQIKKERMTEEREIGYFFWIILSRPQ